MRHVCKALHALEVVPRRSQLLWPRLLCRGNTEGPRAGQHTVAAPPANIEPAAAETKARTALRQGHPIDTLAMVRKKDFKTIIIIALFCRSVHDVLQLFVFTFLQFAFAITTDLAFPALGTRSAVFLLS